MLELLSAATDWTEGDKHLLRTYTASDKALADAQLSLETQALNLVEWFRRERAALQEAAGRSESGAPTYAPLNLFARRRKGSLEIFWQEVHRTKTGRTMYAYLRRNAKGHYTTRELMTRAKDFERELVALAEERAQKLRGQWRQSTLLRQQLAASMKIARSELQTLTAAARAAGMDAFVPGGQDEI